MNEVKEKLMLLAACTFGTFLLHRFNPELMQIIIDAGTFCGVVLIVLGESKSNV